MDPAKVKIHYRKAVMIVHPDRLSGQPLEHRLAAERIFDILTDAHAKYENEAKSTPAPSPATLNATLNNISSGGGLNSLQGLKMQPKTTSPPPTPSPAPSTSADTSASSNMGVD